MKQNKLSAVLQLLQAFLLCIFILSASVALPVLFRPFYYLHIEPLQIPVQAAASAEEVRQAYDDIMNYCIGLSDRFAAGVFPFSEEGAAHFTDVRGLFLLDFACLLISSILLFLIWIYHKRNRISPCRFCGRTALFWGPVILISLSVVLGFLVSLDFYKAFMIFHRIFFPGKENWMFSGLTDPVIYIFPQQFFVDCALLILISMILLCLLFIGLDFRKTGKKKA